MTAAKRGRVRATWAGVACAVAVAGSMAVGASARAIGGAGLHPVTPARLLDTRPGEGTVDGAGAGIGRVPGGFVQPLQVAGRGGVPTNATSVMLNVTAVNPDDAGFLTVYPCGENRPVASNVNYRRGDVAPNAVLAKVGEQGRICIYTHATTHVIVDVNGYSWADGLPPISPARLLDTRPGGSTVDGFAAQTGRISPGGTLELNVAGRGGVPAVAASAMLNVTVVNPSSAGYITVFPCGQPRPNASSVNYSAGRIVPNAVLASLGEFGRVCIFSLAETDLIVDANGYSIVGGPPPTAPARVLDSRPGEGTVDGAGAGIGRVPGGFVQPLQVAGRGGVPTNATSVMLNVTAVNPDDAGFLTVYPCGENRPVASNVNYRRGDVAPNAVLAKIGEQGRICIYTHATTHVIVDVNGYSTTYDERRWDNFDLGWWSYDGDGNGWVEEIWRYVDADDAVDAIGYDVDQNGTLDWMALDLFGGTAIDTWMDTSRQAGLLMYVDPNRDGAFELHLYDEQGDGYAEWVFGDFDANSFYEAVMYDPGQDGMYEAFRRDNDGDGIADTWVTYPVPAPQPPTPATSLADIANGLAANIFLNQTYASQWGLYGPGGAYGPTLLGAMFEIPTLDIG